MIYIYVYTIINHHVPYDFMVMTGGIPHFPRRLLASSEMFGGAVTLPNS